MIRNIWYNRIIVDSICFKLVAINPLKDCGFPKLVTWVLLKRPFSSRKIKGVEFPKGRRVDAKRRGSESGFSN